MRPVELIAEGFGPFRDRITVDFTDTGFFALVGPTGAGKSSVIDAICFALYGIVPRYDDARLVAPALTTGVNQARVQFRFTVAEQAYVVARVVRRTQRGATTKECRVEQVTAAGNQVLAGDAASAGKLVAELLGLSPEHFTRAVVLPQGEFAKFLHDRPADRQKLLVELLGLDIYARMASAARARARDAELTAQGVAGQLSDLEHATAQAVTAARDQVAALDGLREVVTASAPQVQAAVAAIRAAEEALHVGQADLAALAAIHVPREVAERGEKVVAAQQELGLAQEQADDAEAAAQAAEARLAAGPDGDHLKELRRQHEQLALQLAELAAAEPRAEELAVVANTAAQALATAESDVTRARDDLMATQATHAGHVLAAQLVVGADCPVCQQPVTALPAIRPLADLDRSRAQLAEAEARRGSAQAAERAAQTRAIAAAQAATSLAAAVTALQGALADQPPADAVRTDLAVWNHSQQVARDARGAAGAARNRLRAALAALDKLQVEQERSAGAYTAQRDQIAHLGAPSPTGELGKRWSLLAQWALGRAQDLTQEVVHLEQDAKARTAHLAGLLAGLVEAAATAGLELPTGADFEQITVTVVAAQAHAQARADQLARDRDRRSQLEEQKAALLAQVRVNSYLGQLLSAAGFESWVLEEALSELVAGASATLRELSQDAYSLALGEDRAFVVIDHREADAIRPAKTLSGGETFQASLALALSLADHLGQFAAGGAAKLESIFLDEGFGTLDEDSLEVVAATLETLASGSRIVGVVTHVKELANRVPVRFEVSRRGRTAVVERSTQ